MRERERVESLSSGNKRKRDTESRRRRKRFSSNIRDEFFFLSFHVVCLFVCCCAYRGQMDLEVSHLSLLLLLLLFRGINLFSAVRVREGRNEGRKEGIGKETRNANECVWAQRESWAEQSDERRQSSYGDAPYSRVVVVVECKWQQHPSSEAMDHHNKISKLCCRCWDQRKTNNKQKNRS